MNYDSRSPHVTAHCELCDGLYFHPTDSQIFVCDECFELLTDATAMFNAESIDELISEINDYLREQP